MVKSALSPLYFNAVTCSVLPRSIINSAFPLSGALPVYTCPLPSMMREIAEMVVGLQYPFSSSGVMDWSSAEVILVVIVQWLRSIAPSCFTLIGSNVSVAVAFNNLS